MQSYHFIEDVPLVHMNCNQSFELCPLDRRQFKGGLVNQLIEEIQKTLVRPAHDLLIKPGILESIGCISGPDQLYSKKTDLATCEFSKSYFVTLNII